MYIRFYPEVTDWTN